MKRVLFALVALLLPTSLFAQVPTIASVRVDVSRVSTPTVIAVSVVVPWAGFTCNLPKTTLPVVSVNPGSVEFNDPADALRACKGSVAATINALVPADYTAKAAFIYSDSVVGGISLASNPFTRFDYQNLQGIKLGQ
jgi:hypothetical protein